MKNKITLSGKRMLLFLYHIEYKHDNTLNNKMIAQTTLLPHMKPEGGRFYIEYVWYAFIEINTISLLRKFGY